MLWSFCFGLPNERILHIVVDSVNGLLCDEISVNSLVHGLKRFVSGEVIFDRDAISKSASEKFALEKQANAYIELYREILV